MTPFSAAEDPWIAVHVRPDAPPGELNRLLPGAAPASTVTTGLRGVMRAAHLITDLKVPQPPVEAMIRRLLAALTARIGGLDTPDPAAWDAARTALAAQGRFAEEAVGAYFDTWAHRLRLNDDERPFLQDPRLEKECGPVGVPARLDMTRPSGNNAQWESGLRADQPVPAAEAVGWLLAWHGYGPAGLGAQRTHAGRTGRSAKAAPYRGFLSVFPHDPGSLFGTLVASVPAPEHWPAGNRTEDWAPWEAPTLPDPLRPAAPQGVVGLLAGRSAHAVLLKPDAAGDVSGCWVTWAMLDDLPAAADPYLILRDTSGPVRAQYGRAPWQELDALLAPTAVRGKNTLHRPAALSSAVTLPAGQRDRLGVRVIGWDQDRQERNRAWWAVSVPRLLAHAEEADAAAAQRAVRTRAAAEAAASGLGKALAAAWHAVHPGRRPEERQALLGPAISTFLERVEPHVWLTLRDPDHQVPWRKLQVDVFDRAAQSMGTGRGASAVACSRASLTRTAPSGSNAKTKKKKEEK